MRSKRLLYTGTIFLMALLTGGVSASACGWGQDNCYYQHDRAGNLGVVGCRAFLGDAAFGFLSFLNLRTGYSYVIFTTGNPQRYAGLTPAEFERVGFAVAPQAAPQVPWSGGGMNGGGSYNAEACRKARESYQKCMDDARNAAGYSTMSSLMSTCQRFLSLCR